MTARRYSIYGLADPDIAKQTTPASADKNPRLLRSLPNLSHIPRADSRRAITPSSPNKSKHISNLLITQHRPILGHRISSRHPTNHKIASPIKRDIDQRRSILLEHIRIPSQRRQHRRKPTPIHPMTMHAERRINPRTGITSRPRQRNLSRLRVIRISRPA